MTNQTIYVPDIGGAEGAEVVELLVSVGDSVDVEQSLIVLESDKASMEIPASHAGVVVELKMAVGDQLAEGDAILVVEVLGETEVVAKCDEPNPTGRDRAHGKRELIVWAVLSTNPSYEYQRIQVHVRIQKRNAQNGPEGWPKRVNDSTFHTE